MKKSELIKLLLLTEAEEVYVQDGDYEYDIDVEESEECFDGFDTVYPARVTLKASAKEKEQQASFLQ